MRTLLALVLLAVATPAFAQATYADSTGGYVALNRFGLNLFGTIGADATVGYRFGNGLDVGVRARRTTFLLGTVDETVAGTVVGYTRPVGALTGRLEGAVLFTAASASQGDYTDGAGAYTPASTARVRALSQDVTASVSRQVPLTGTLRIRPTVGAYVASSQLLSVSGIERTASDRSAFVSTGLHLEAPLSVRLFGRDAALTPVVRIPVAGGVDAAGARYAYAGGGLRLNL